MFTESPSAVIAQGFQLSGIVQGVGMRPHIYRLAQELGICGCVFNHDTGIRINAWATAKILDEFASRIIANSPPLAKNISLQRHELNGSRPTDFTIIESTDGRVSAELPPDCATCPECLQEIFDPQNRRYHYPFSTCSHCGPRYSIAKDSPFDRANTSMALFEPCPQCETEYFDPQDRRFHAQTISCPNCGPQLWLENACSEYGQVLATDDVLSLAADYIKQGKILAIKGVGGFNLICDAMNCDAIDRLRQRKNRPDKPFALMPQSTDSVSQYVYLDDQAVSLLKDPSAPIVLLPKKDSDLPQDVAPNQHTLGFILPYSPLHHLLMSYLKNPILFTSGNSSGNPICVDNELAKIHLCEIADYFLFHDREIIHRQDDSVVRIVNQNKQTIRRSRGLVPLRQPLPRGFESTPFTLAMGADLKNTYCVLNNGSAEISSHGGDLHKMENFHVYKNKIHMAQNIDLIAIDTHPNYVSSRLGKKIAEANQSKICAIQHHHAHITACMAEHNLPLNTNPVLGIALDGIGFGDNGELWGGEFLLTDYRRITRLAHFQPVPLPGGERAMIEPWRNTYAHLSSCLGWEMVLQDYPDLNIIKYLKEKPLPDLNKMIQHGINSPLASSTGRLFDAVAATLGICRDRVSYEGQAAMELETLALQCNDIEDRIYPYGLSVKDNQLIIEWKEFWSELLNDVQSETPKSTIAKYFYNTLANILFQTSLTLTKQHDISHVILGGGVFQSSLLLELVLKNFKDSELTVLFSEEIPTNDGGISLGQAVIAAASVKTTSCDNPRDLE